MIGKPSSAARPILHSALSEARLQSRRHRAVQYFLEVRQWFQGQYAKERGTSALGGAIDEGMNTRATFESDADLAGLRSDPRFAQLLGRLPAAPPSGATP